MFRASLPFFAIATLLVCPSSATPILGPGKSGMFVLQQGRILFEETPEWQRPTITSASTYRELHPLQFVPLEQGDGQLLVGGLMEHWFGTRLLWHSPPCYAGRTAFGDLLFLGVGEERPKLAGVVDASGSFSVRIPPEMREKEVYLYFGGSMGGSYQLGLDSLTIRSLIQLPAKEPREHR